ncbi:MAG: type II toxin-antitoxin system prevent-host-death family antitoxin [Hyphomicrobiaceae bacterium]
MRVYKFSEARQKLAEVLDLARDEDVLIERRGGETFVLSLKRAKASPLDLPVVNRGLVTTEDVIEAVRESREQAWRK